MSPEYLEGTCDILAPDGGLRQGQLRELRQGVIARLPGNHVILVMTQLPREQTGSDQCDKYCWYLAKRAAQAHLAFPIVLMLTYNNQQGKIHYNYFSAPPPKKKKQQQQQQQHLPEMQAVSKNRKSVQEIENRNRASVAIEIPPNLVAISRMMQLMTMRVTNFDIAICYQKPVNHYPI